MAIYACAEREPWQYMYTCPGYTFHYMFTTRAANAGYN